MKKYICSICGYVHDGDEPPASCPVCGVPAEKFNLVEETAPAEDCSELAAATGLKPETLAKADKIVAKYPERRSATLPLLHLAQEELGYVTDAAMKWIAAKLGIEPINVYEVVTFYPMFRLAPIGRRHVKVCRTLSCALRGSYKTMEALEKEFGCRRGETSADGNVTLEFVECMACCGTGPIVQVDHLFYEKVTPEEVPALAEKIRASLVDPNYGKKEPNFQDRTQWLG
ncbi:NADH-quinone oxidoreductase subunit NuoE [Candidatus Spyradosoma sp. SGI.093]|uniref:NADH-quinone oxidoreductase subunit NuoE n=1 Tax=Candidatus Spyradosoma sp. SGI.093 TaxID=3420583 RepID=UPI003CFF4710